MMWLFSKERINKRSDFPQTISYSIQFMKSEIQITKSKYEIQINYYAWIYHIVQASMFIGKTEQTCQECFWYSLQVPSEVPQHKWDVF